MSHTVIDCDTCTQDGTAACADCVVTHLLAPPHREPVVLDLAEMRAVRLLSEAGLVPTLRHREAT
ncbi:MAG: hypothetical protein ACO3AV_02460 [Ilumatobacteraceae bacterium]|jgi:hypothetical protein